MRSSSREEQFRRCVEWAERQEDVRAFAVVGSSARRDHQADQWSDYDCLLVAQDPQRYLSSPDWLEEIGSVWFQFVERAPDGRPVELRALFAGGWDIDFLFVSVADARLGLDRLAMIGEILKPGFLAIFDKDRLLPEYSTAPTPLASIGQPPEEVFLEVVNDFWFHVAWSAKKLRRGELWIAKTCCDQYLKTHLLRMVEWEAQAEYGWETDTWYRGRFLEEWALPETLEELRGAFAWYNREDVQRALEVSQRTFERIALRLSRQWGYTYPLENCRQVQAWTADLLRANE